MFTKVGEVIKAMYLDTVDVTFEGTLLSMDFDKPWTNPAGKSYVFNNALFQSDKGGRIPVSLEGQVIDTMKDQGKKFMGKKCTVTCEARFYKGSARFYLISLEV